MAAHSCYAEPAMDIELYVTRRELLLLRLTWMPPTYRYYVCLVVSCLEALVERGKLGKAGSNPAGVPPTQTSLIGSL